MTLPRIPTSFTSVTYFSEKLLSNVDNAALCLQKSLMWLVLEGGKESVHTFFWEKLGTPGNT